ncbi:HlyD family secretion protein [Rhodoblastus sp.]|uniref:HlyD family secretion protein n=1 Tax=Rhodoblastus sp. TaxID=1962975 RepID=UPI0035AF2DAF
MTSSAEPEDRDDPPPKARPSRRRWIIAGAVTALALLYFAPGSFVAYTDDAYVRSDFVEVAPQVAGVIERVEVANDQKVAVGAPLAAIDPHPFDLAVALIQRRVDEAVAAAKVKQDEARVLNADLDAARAAVTLAQRDYDRYAALVNDQAIAQASMDRSANERQKALDTAAGVEAKLRVNAGAVAAALAQVDVAKAELALAQYNLSRTRLVAPVPGFVTNLALRPGAYASVGVPVIGLVDDTQWRVVANFKEYVASRLKPGMRAWIWLDSHPWKLFPARVSSVGRGISREQEAGRLLPYVAPTTDWIRLARRMQVTLTFDPLPDAPLFMGADARVVLFP